MDTVTQEEWKKIELAFDDAINELKKHVGMLYNHEVERTLNSWLEIQKKIKNNAQIK